MGEETQYTEKVRYINGIKVIERTPVLSKEEITKRATNIVAGMRVIVARMEAKKAKENPR